MTREEILNGIKMLACSQGFYGRLLAALHEKEEACPEEYEEIMEYWESMNFSDIVDFVIYIEG